MKVRYFVPVLALLALGGPAVFAQTAGNMAAQQSPNMGEMGQRFQQMSRIMEQAQTAHGTQLAGLMQQHMHLMQEQM